MPLPTLHAYQSTHDLSQLDLSGTRSTTLKTKMKDDHRYNALRNVDDHSDSSTEVEDWDVEGEVKTRQQRRRGTKKTRSCWRRIRGCRWVLDTVLLLVIVGLLVEKRWRRHHESHRFELAGDISGFAPRFSQQIVTFKPDAVFAPEDAEAFWSNETQRAWLGIVPEGLGYVKVSNPSAYNNLPHPIHDYPNHTVFTTSVTHQLHCLYTILEAYNLQKVTLSTGIAADPIKMPWHINHCFEYLRQAVMCTGDVALEGAATTFPGDAVTGEDLGGSDGWDAKHVCRDYSQVYAYLERNTINHMKWIASD